LFWICFLRFLILNGSQLGEKGSETLPFLETKRVMKTVLVVEDTAATLRNDFDAGAITESKSIQTQGLLMLVNSHLAG
jgi:hypothetical protein